MFNADFYPTPPDVAATMLEREEEWKDIPGYEGRYKVSTMGRVKSIARFVDYGNGKALRSVRGRIMKATLNTSGYPTLCLCINNNCKRFKVHRLVMAAFAGECPKWMEVAHSDGVRTNCALQNLRYATPSENRQDSILQGTHARGSRHANSKLTCEQVAFIRADPSSHRSLARKFEVSESTIRNIRKHNTYAVDNV